MTSDQHDVTNQRRRSPARDCVSVDDVNLQRRQNRSRLTKFTASWKRRLRCNGQSHYTQSSVTPGIYCGDVPRPAAIWRWRMNETQRYGCM